MKNAVEVKNVSMRFNLARERVDSLKEYVVRRLSGRQPKSDEFWALKNINLTIPEGDSMALIGTNGSGDTAENHQRYSHTNYRRSPCEWIHCPSHRAGGRI